MTINLPPAFMSKAIETLTSQYGNPDTVDVEHRDEGWVVVCRWAERESFLVVGSREEAEIVAASVRSDFMP